MPNPSHEPPASSKAPNEDLKDIDVLCTFEIKKERAEILNIGVIKTSYNIQVKTKMLNLSQKPLALTKAPNKDLKDMDVLFTFQIKVESQNSEYVCTKDQ